MKIKSEIKKIISILLIVSMALNNSVVFADGIDVNVSGGEGEGYTGGGAGDSNAIVGDLELKGARVSLWDVETQERIGDVRDMVDFSKKSYEEVSKFRRLSGLTKPEIMVLKNNGDGPHYFFNKKNTIYAKMLICQDIVELNQKQIYIM